MACRHKNKVAEVSWLDTFKEYIREKEAGEYTKDLKILSASHLSLKSYEKICMKNWSIDVAAKHTVFENCSKNRMNFTYLARKFKPMTIFAPKTLMTKIAKTIVKIDCLQILFQFCPQKQCKKWDFLWLIFTDCALIALFTNTEKSHSHPNRILQRKYMFIWMRKFFEVL